MNEKQRTIGVAVVIVILIQIACSGLYPGATEVDFGQTSTVQALALFLQATQQSLLAEQQNLTTQVAETVQAAMAANVQPVEAPPIPSTSMPTNTIQVATNTPEYSPTPEVPMVSVSVDTNCRTGPGSAYTYVGALYVGETAEVVGKFPSGNFWIIKNPNGINECWITGQYATVVGDTSMLKVYKQPPTPTPEEMPTPTKTP